MKNVDVLQVRLSDFQGKKIVLYFYPEDNTSGCTKEACSFRDVYNEILDKNAVVIGISPDTSASHQKFRNKHSLPFYLLSDENHEHGAWGKKKDVRQVIYGNKKGNIYN